MAAFAVVKSGLFNWHGQDDVFVKYCPLLLCALAVAVPLRGGLYNLGGEGQMYIGALCATLPALFLPGNSAAITVSTCLLCGASGGAIWAAVAGLLKTCRGTNEVISTLLLNYIAIQLVSMVVSGPLKATDAPYPYSNPVRAAAILPTLSDQGQSHWGLPISIFCALAVWGVLSQSLYGLSLKIIGENRRVAAYAGINVNQTQIMAFIIGGAAAGLAGALEVIAVKHRLFHMFGGNYGYEGW